MDVIVLIGRVLFVFVFAGSAMGHLTQTDAMGGYAESRGVPAARAATQVTGLLMAAGALSVLLGVWADLGALLLAVFVIPTAVVMHPFWKEDPEAQQMEQIQFMKDMSLGGGAIALFGFFAGVEDLGLTITGPLFPL